MSASGNMDIFETSDFLSDWLVDLSGDFKRGQVCTRVDLESRWKFTDKGHLVVRGTLCFCVASTFDICQLFDDPVPVVHPNPTEAKEDSIDVNFSLLSTFLPHRSQFRHIDHKITMWWVFWGPDLKWFSTKVGVALYLILEQFTHVVDNLQCWIFKRFEEALLTIQKWKGHVLKRPPS